MIRPRSVRIFFAKLVQCCRCVCCVLNVILQISDRIVFKQEKIAFPCYDLPQSLACGRVWMQHHSNGHRAFVLRWTTSWPHIWLCLSPIYTFQHQFAAEKSGKIELLHAHPRIVDCECECVDSVWIFIIIFVGSPYNVYALVGVWADHGHCSCLISFRGRAMPSWKTENIHEMKIRTTQKPRRSNHIVRIQSYALAHRRHTFRLPFNIKTLIPFVMLQAAWTMPHTFLRFISRAGSLSLVLSYSLGWLCCSLVAMAPGHRRCSKYTLLLVRLSSIGHKRHFSSTSTSVNARAAIPLLYFCDFQNEQTHTRSHSATLHIADNSRSGFAAFSQWLLSTFPPPSSCENPKWKNCIMKWIKLSPSHATMHRTDGNWETTANSRSKTKQKKSNRQLNDCVPIVGLRGMLAPRFRVENHKWTAARIA